MPKFELGVQPPSKRTKKSPRRLDKFDACPRCDGLKHKSARACRACTYKRPAVEQPDDALIRHAALTRNQVAIIDADMYAEVLGSFWQARWNKDVKAYYAVRAGMPNELVRSVYMHRQIMRVSGKIQIDHINGNTLDNRRCNLRIVTSSENHCNHRGVNRTNNTSGFIGVVRNKRVHKWVGHLTIRGRLISCGYYDTKEDAARARDKMAVKHHGVFARLNFPDDRDKYERELRKEANAS